MMGRGTTVRVLSTWFFFKSAQMIQLLVHGVKVGGPARKPAEGEEAGGEGELAKGGGTSKLVPVIFDAFIRKAHHTARFPLTLAFLRLTCCAHLSHWLDDSHDQ